MNRVRQTSMCMVLGIFIGAIVPLVMFYWPEETVGEASLTTSELTEGFKEERYKFQIVNDELFVVQYGSGQHQKVIFSGVDISDWSLATIDLARRTEFSSLDDVQSFIDTTREELSIE
ncbi:MAG: hypothetical protein M0T74_14900 [Desulfitobacterium hafniense]|nr:hypothetical protein [Desulfitobacterium hafniense]